jgi:ribosomal-protein-alanine N-acetyltransferase
MGPQGLDDSLYYHCILHLVRRLSLSGIHVFLGRVAAIGVGFKVGVLLSHWAVEIPNQHKFIGFVGLHTTKDNMPFSPCVEIGWRLSKQHWGKGYAIEAATKALEYAFNKLNLAEVVSFTTLANIRSMVVMQNIGMRNSGQNFMHPGIEVSHPQCEHVLYKIIKSEWQKNAL